MDTVIDVTFHSWKVGRKKNHFMWFPLPEKENTNISPKNTQQFQIF